MTREEATALIEALYQAQTHLSLAVEHAKNVSNAEESRSLQTTLATAIGDIAGDAIAPILSLYPDLDPYEKHPK